MRKFLKEHYVGIFVTVGLIFTCLLIFADCKINVANAVTKLSEYEISICEEYKSKDMPYEDKVSEVLDNVEDYIDNNRWNLLIVSYSKNKDSLDVSFAFGLSTVFAPGELLSNNLGSID